MEVKFTLYHTIRAKRGNRAIALRIVNIDVRWGWVVSATSRQLYPRESALVPIVEETVWAPDPVGKVRRRKMFCRQQHSVPGPYVS